MNFLKKLSLQLCALAALAFAVNAHATVIIEDPIDPVPDIAITPGHSYSFVHDITLDGYLPGTTILDADLGIHLLLPKAFKTTLNKFTFYIGSSHEQTLSCTTTACISTKPSGQIFDISLNAAAVSELEHTGKLPVTILALSGGFLFGDSDLEVTAIPEPATLALLGFGLLGFCAARRRT